MTTQHATPPGVDPHTRRKRFLALGVLLLILGAAAAGATTLLELTSMLVFGPIRLAAAVIQIVVAFLAETRKEAILHLAASGIEALFGFCVMAQPLQAAVSLAVLAAAFLLLSAAARLIRSLVSPTPGRGWFAMAGIAALLLAGSLSVGWPNAGPWFVGLCIALDLLCHGLSWSALAWAERNPFETTRASPP
jgi:uncharacterized membrane protein HdeD (DUF308 family)